MQDPNTGTLHPIESLDDPAREGKEHWETYEVGEKVRFRGWWWEIVDISGEGLRLRPSHRASISERLDDARLLKRELEETNKRGR